MEELKSWLDINKEKMNELEDGTEKNIQKEA